MGSRLVDDVEDYWGEPTSNLVCLCGGTYLHQGKIEVFTRLRGEDTDVTAIVIDRNAIELGDPNRNPSARRDGLIIHFDCEECGSDEFDEPRPRPHAIRLAIFQHKGQTYLRLYQEGG